MWYPYCGKLTKEERGDDQIFPEHTHLGPKVSRPLSRLSKAQCLQQLFVNDLLSLTLCLLCGGESAAFVICQRSMDSSQACPWVFLFWHPEAPALTEAWQGTSQGEQWRKGLFPATPCRLIQHWLPATQTPLKVREARRSPALRRTRLVPASFYTHFFLSTISPFPLRGQKRGISQKEMPEFWRRRLSFLSCFFPPATLSIVLGVIALM